ncbi:MAG: HU family DNA-binding protein, partial [Balneolaceae bacterium]
MHIDHSKLVELLTEATGLKKENVEKQLLDLVDEIKAAISDGDAYEVDGFGVFSGIGNNIIFIPADDLATEINYKYAGMEPLIMDEATDDEAPADTHEEETTLDDEDDPFAGLMDKEDEPEEKKSSFELDVADEEDGAGFDEPETEDVDEFADETADEAPFDIAEENLEDDTEEEITPDLDSEEKPGPEKWGIDTYKDDSAEGMFSGLLGDKGKDQPEEDQSTDEDEGQEDDFSSLFDEMEDEPADDSDLAAELSKQLSDDPSLEDEPDDDLLGSFLNDDESEGEEEEQEEEALSAESESEPDEVFSSEEDSKEEEADTEPEESFTSEIEDPETKADSEDNEDIDFDDPFETLAEEDEEENEEDDESFDVEETSDDHEEPVPVITNLASEGAKKESKEKKDLRPEEPAKRNVAEQKTQNQPVLLWVLLIIIGLSAGIYGLGYFGVVYIPGVTTQPQVASVSEPTPPPPEQSENDPEEPATQET